MFDIDRTSLMHDTSAWTVQISIIVSNARIHQLRPIRAIGFANADRQLIPASNNLPRRLVA